jgi:exodeoxyribonuclease VII large subunit
LHVLSRRFRSVPVLLYPVPVQGAGAAREIAAMLALADQRQEVDVLLLVRGGGSLEDLWSFNDEALARAIAAMRLPVVTGIGHEIDFTIADFVADVRAPTPSAAAELAVPDAAACRQALAVTAARLRAAVQEALRRRRVILADGARRLERLHPSRAVRDGMQRLDELQARALAAMRREGRARADCLRRLRAELAAVSPAARLAALGQRAQHAGGRLPTALRHVLAVAGGRLHAAARGLGATSPLATLDRGYAIVTLIEGGVVRDPADAPPGTDIEARVARGTLRARVLPAGR